MAFWTKRNVAKMSDSRLIEWTENIIPDLERAEAIGVKIEASEKAYTLLQAEIKKRKISL